MKPYVFVPLALALGLTLPPLAAAQPTDFMTAKKIACVPERVTRCKSPGVECESKDASARDKAEVLIVDFESKKASVRRGTEEKAFGAVLEDKVEGDARAVVIGETRPDGQKRSLIFSLKKSGKMEGSRDDGRITMETTCSAAT